MEIEPIYHWRTVHLPVDPESAYDIGIIAAHNNLPFKIKADFIEARRVEGRPPVIVYESRRDGSNRRIENIHIRTYDGRLIIIGIDGICAPQHMQAETPNWDTTQANIEEALRTVRGFGHGNSYGTVIQEIEEMLLRHLQQMTPT